MERIEAVTNVQIVELARKNLAEDRVSVTAIGPA
jgi:predicted Zn-dependent peptidase